MAKKTNKNYKAVTTGKEVLVGVTGSIAAYKAADLVSQLKKAGHAVTVIMTECAQKFVARATFQSLSRNRVITDLFVEESEYDPLHVCLATGASVLVIAPATANIIGKLANGIADDALTCTAMATNAPVIIAPAMNAAMYANPIVQENLKKLAGLGWTIVEPEEGVLASGAWGKGRLAGIDNIIKEIEKTLKK